MFFQKSHSAKSGSQEIDAKIERAITEQINELREQLDERIQKQIVGDRAFVKDTIGVAFKVAGSAVALVVIVLGALGWKNLAEIQKEMVQAAREKAEAQFVSKEGKQIINATLDRSVLNSYLIQMALLRTDKAQRLRIEDHDAGRLLRIIKDTETDNVTFESAAKILITALSQEGPGTLRFALVSDICETFAGFVTAKNRDEKWLANNYQKRMWLLNELSETAFSHDLLRAAYRDLLDTSAPLALRQAAVRNIGKIGDKEAQDKLVKMVATGNDLRLDALVAIAQIDITSKTLTDWISSLDKLLTPSGEEIACALKVSEALQRSNREAGAKLIQFAAKHSVLVMSNTKQQFGSDAFPEELYVVPLPDLKTMKDKGRFPSTALRQDGHWTPVVKTLLKECAKQSDVNVFRNFVSWLIPASEYTMNYPEEGVNSLALHVSLSSGAIRLENGNKSDESLAPKGVWLRPERFKEEIEGAKKVSVYSNRLKVIDIKESTNSVVETNLGFLSSLENADALVFGDLVR